MRHYLSVINKCVFTSTEIFVFSTQMIDVDNSVKTKRVFYSNFISKLTIFYI